MFRANQYGGRLTKLRYVCSLCGTNCIDEHGYAQHLTSEKHIRNELAEEERRLQSGPRRFEFDEFSRQFETAFLDCLRACHLDQAVLAHDVYREAFENDRQMKQLERSCFGSFGQFVTSLRDRGRVEATRAAEGWKIRLTASSLGTDGELPGDEPEPLRAWEKKRKWNEAGAPAAHAPSRSRDPGEERALALAAAAATKAATNEAAAGEEDVSSQPTALKRDDGAAKLTFGLKRKAGGAMGAGGGGSSSGVLDRGTAASQRQRAESCAAWPAEEASGAAPEAAAAAATSRGEGDALDEAWVIPDLVVKVLKPAAPWRKRKAIVLRKRLRGDGGIEAKVEAVDGSEECTWAPLHQLETVIPQVGRAVLVCRGAHRGATATLRQIDEGGFCVSVELDGAAQGTLLHGLPYEDVCKLVRPGGAETTR